jgi:hypothetical protein
MLEHAMRDTTSYAPSPSAAGVHVGLHRLAVDAVLAPETSARVCSDMPSRE